MNEEHKISLHEITRFMNPSEIADVWGTLFMWSDTMAVANMLIQDTRLQGRELPEVSIPRVPPRELFPENTHPELGYWAGKMLSGTTDAIISKIIDRMQISGSAKVRTAKILNYILAIRESAMGAEAVA